MAWVPAESAVEELMPRLLPVEPCDLTEGFDPSIPPRTPQEYLRRVQIEAAQCPDVVVAQIDPKKLKRKQSVNISLSGCQPAPEGYSPTLQWQQQQVAQFSAVRQNVNRHRSHWKSQQLDSNVTMPKSEDEEGWKKFCLGERLCSEGAVGPAKNESPGIDYIQIGFPPLLSIVSRMNQATIASVLEYLSNWFGERDFTPELGRWLYALLACLEKPLLPEAHSLIRQLARRCSEVRLLVNSRDDERVPALNLLICLVSRPTETKFLEFLENCLSTGREYCLHFTVEEIETPWMLLYYIRRHMSSPALVVKKLIIVFRYFDQRDLADEPS